MTQQEENETNKEIIKAYLEVIKQLEKIIERGTFALSPMVAVDLDGQLSPKVQESLTSIGYKRHPKYSDIYIKTFF